MLSMAATTRTHVHPERVAHTFSWTLTDSVSLYRSNTLGVSGLQGLRRHSRQH